MTGTREESIGTDKAVETVEIGKDGKEDKSEYLNLAQVPCIRYSITFWKKCVSILALLNSGNKVNAIHLTLSRELELPIRPTDVRAQKINGILLDIFGIIVTAFSVIDKANRGKFFEEVFLVANVSPEVVLEMPFLTLSSANVDFLGRELRWRTYTTKKALPTTKRVELVGKKEFAAAALDPELETYVVHVGSISFNILPSSSPLDVHPSQRP